MTFDRARVTGIVLAGGRSSRFGAPKLAAELHGVALLDHAVRAVAEAAGEVIVAGTPAEAGAAGGVAPSVERGRVRLVVDDAPFAGPLAAVAGVLRSVGTELAIVVGGDMPGLVPAVLDTMLRRLATDADVDAVVLADAVRRQVLPVALRVGPASAGAAAALRSGDQSLLGFLDRLRTAELPAPAWRAVDPEGRTVLDVDVPEDLDRFGGGQIHSTPFRSAPPNATLSPARAAGAPSALREDGHANGPGHLEEAQRE